MHSVYRAANRGSATSKQESRDGRYARASQAIRSFCSATSASGRLYFRLER